MTTTPVYYCNSERCAIFDAIMVSPDRAVVRVTFRGETIAVGLTQHSAEIMVRGLHMGAHLEARQWMGETAR